MKYLNLIRWPYLLILILGQILIKYTFFHPLLEKLFGPTQIPITLNSFGLTLVSAATVCIAAAGFIIYELYNVNSKTINLPYRSIKGEKISVKTAFNLFFALNVLGMLIGFYLANMVGYPSFAILFILASALLYANAKGLKKNVIIRPIIISFLAGLSFLSVGLFDIFPAMNEENGQTLTTFFSVLKDYSIFLALLFLIRELIVNQKNTAIHHKNNWNSLSLSIGVKRTSKVIFILNILPIVAVIFYIYKYLYANTTALIYALALILAPLFFVAIKILMANNKKQFFNLQILMSAVIFFSVISIGLYQFILK